MYTNILVKLLNCVKCIKNCELVRFDIRHAILVCTRSNHGKIDWLNRTTKGNRIMENTIVRERRSFQLNEYERVIETIGNEKLRIVNHKIQYSIYPCLYISVNTCELVLRYKTDLIDKQ